MELRRQLSWDLYWLGDWFKQIAVLLVCTSYKFYRRISTSFLAFFLTLTNMQEGRVRENTVYGLQTAAVAGCCPYVPLQEWVAIRPALYSFFFLH